MLLIILLPIALILSHVALFPKTKGVLRPIKVPANRK